MIAVIVAGIFHFTSEWGNVCPTDAPVNDPAPILWKNMVEKTEGKAALGVPKSVEGSVYIKDEPPAEKND